MSVGIRAALRRLGRAPAFTATLILVIGIGVGGNVAVFTVVNSTVLRPLPFDEPDRLVDLSESHVEDGRYREGVLPGTFLDWRQRSHSLEGVSLYWTAPVVVTSRQEPVRAVAASVTPSFFEVLGVEPLLGRTFPADEDAFVGHEREIVISHALWRSWFGGDPGVLGRTIEVQGRVPLTIVGVMPVQFDFPRDVQLWRAEVWESAFGRGEPERWRMAVGRIAAGVALSAAERELQQITAQLAIEHPSTNQGWTATLTSLDEVIKRSARGPLMALLGAVSLLMLLGCINVATLNLQRGMERRREFATRIAMGASRPRLVLESLVEHALLVATGLLAAAS